MVECLFCRIVVGVAPAHVVHADDACVAFLDHRPAALGHTLVVPRGHVTDLWQAGEDTAAAVMRTAHVVAGRLRERLAPDGLTLRQNNGRASGQHVFHLHVHLVPRWHGDGTIGWPWPPPDDVDLSAVLAQLRDEDARGATVRDGQEAVTPPGDEPGTRSGTLDAP